MKKISLVFITTGLVFLACGPARTIVPTLTLAPTATPGPAAAELLVSKANPGSLILDAKSLYWSNCDAWESKNGTIKALSKSRATVETLASGQACPFSLKADGNALYWIDHEGIEGGVHNVFRLPKNGGTPEVVTSDSSVFRTLLVDDTYLYWWTKDGAGMRLPKSGSGQPEALPFPAKYILASDGAEVYWQNANGDLIRSGKDGSQPVTLAPGSDFAPAEVGGHRISSSIVAVFPRQSEVYFKVYTDGNPGMVSCSDQHTTLMKAAKNGGKAVAVAQAAGFADALLVEPAVYFGGGCIEGISKVRLESQASEVFIKDPTPVWFLISDGEFIYWVTRGDGSILRALE
jgi:hypothetical protein